MGPAAPGELWPLASAVWSAAISRGPRGRFGQARLLFCSPPPTVTCWVPTGRTQPAPREAAGPAERHVGA